MDGRRGGLIVIELERLQREGWLWWRLVGQISGLRWR